MPQCARGSSDSIAGRAGVVAWCVLFILFSFFALSGCGERDDAEAVRAWIQQGASLAEQHDIGGLLDFTSEDFRARPGDLDRNAVKGILWRAFRYYGDFTVLYPRPSVRLSEDGEKGSASCPFLIVKKEAPVPGLQELYEDPRAWVEEAGKKADLYRLTLGLQKETGEWRVQEAQLERFTGVGFDP